MQQAHDHTLKGDLMDGQVRHWVTGVAIGTVLLSACGGSVTPAAPASSAAAPAAASAAAAPSSAPASAAAPAAKPSTSTAASVAAPAGASAAYKPAAPLSPAVTVKVGNLHSLAESPATIADARGYFKAEGLNVQLVDFTVTADALPALGTGQIDLMTGGVNPALFNSVLRGVNVQVVADAGSQAPGNDWLGINVRKDLIDSGRYKGPKDLKGMKIGLPGPYSIVHYMLKVLLEKNGLSLKDVDATGIGLPGSVTALANKALDANATIEPFLSEPERQGIGKVVLRSNDILPDLVGAVFLMSPEFRNKNPEAARRYMIAWERGVRDYLDAFTKNKGRDDVIKLLQDNKIAINTNAQIPTYNLAGTFPLKGLQDLLKWYQDEAQVKGELDLNKVVDFSLVQEAVKTLGP